VFQALSCHSFSFGAYSPAFLRIINFLDYPFLHRTILLPYFPVPHFVRFTHHRSPFFPAPLPSILILSFSFVSIISSLTFICFRSTPSFIFLEHPNSLQQWIINLTPLLSPSSPTLPSFPLSSVSRVLYDLPSFLITIPILLSPPNIHQTLAALLTHLTTFAPLLPALSLSLLFLSSTIYTESITLSKYPKAYHAYRERVGMFGSAKTWQKGLELGWTGRKTEVEELIWGKEGKDE
jgi:hypothetical protein